MTSAARIAVDTSSSSSNTTVSPSRSRRSIVRPEIRFATASSSSGPARRAEPPGSPPGTSHPCRGIGRRSHRPAGATPTTCPCRPRRSRRPASHLQWSDPPVTIPPPCTGAPISSRPRTRWTRALLAQRNGTDVGAHEAGHREAEFVHQATHDPVAALVQRDPHQRRTVPPCSGTNSSAFTGPSSRSTPSRTRRDSERGTSPRTVAR